MGRKRTELTPEQLTEAIALLEKHESLEAIASLMGLSVRTLRNALIREGVWTPPVGRKTKYSEKYGRQKAYRQRNQSKDTTTS